MIDNRLTFAEFIDELRKSRNISKEDFIENIISGRHYRRYLKNESTISNEKFLMLLSRLEMNITSVLNSFYMQDNHLENIVYTIYNKIILLEHKEAYELVKKHKNRNFPSTFIKNLFDFCSIYLEMLLKLKPTKTGIIELKDLIGYPKCLEHNIVNFFEVATLTCIMQHTESKQSMRKIAEFLYKVIREEKYILPTQSGTSHITIYSSLAKVMGILKEYEKVVQISNIAIQECKKRETYVSLAHLFYYKAVALYFLKEEKDKYEVCLHNLSIVLELEGNKNKINSFDKIIKKRFNYNLFD